jgi:predicted DNA-binding ArsR family transcriptional regulator
MNRIKVVNDPAELVPILRAVDTKVKREVFKDVAQNWRTAKDIRERFGEEGVEALGFFEKMKLVETKWQTGEDRSPVKAYHAFYSAFHINASSPILEISDILSVAMMSEKEYGELEGTIYDLVGEQGKFAGDVADALGVNQTTLKALVKRSSRLDFRGHRIQRFTD